MKRGAPALTWRISMLPVSGLVRQPAGAADDERPRRIRRRRLAPGVRIRHLPSERSVDPEPIEEAGTAEFGSADALVVTGSIHGGLASRFAQPRAFGNNRPDTESVRTGSFSILGGTSAWDARPFSFSRQPGPKPGYVDLEFDATFGGAVSRARNESRRLPVRERRRNRGRSCSLRARRWCRPRRSAPGRLLGNPGARRDATCRYSTPVTGRPFESATIPANRISPQAEALLAFYTRSRISRPAFCTTSRRRS